MATALQKLTKRIDKRNKRFGYDSEYFIPGLWADPTGNSPREIRTNPFDFLSSMIRSLKSMEAVDHSGGPIVYNMMLRYTSAWDHDHDGQIGCPAGRDLMRETGTFAKSIALLPYIASLGINTIHLLPVTAIGRYGHKGQLGSPYAIHNPYKLDTNLCEPLLGADVELEYSAFIEAAHLIGMKVINEFVFRTVSIDSELALSNPQWFYWIHSERAAEFASPVFDYSALQNLKQKIADKDFRDLPDPSDEYKDMFTSPPTQTKRSKKGRPKATSDDGKSIRIPGAFADWPPDDIQPPWDDVTYLRLFDHPDFNYIAYNTVRMYEQRLNTSENKVADLWEYLAEIIPYYVRKYNIDGVMIDMGHALPIELRRLIRQRALAIKPDLAFWEENFRAETESAAEGYSAVTGKLALVSHIPAELRKQLLKISHDGLPLNIFAGPETHNTPRSASRPGGIGFTKFMLGMMAFMPGNYYLLSGIETGETGPINTGLGFEDIDTTDLDQNNLPLFSAMAMNWEANRKLLKFIRKMVSLRNEFHELICDRQPGSLRMLEASSRRLVAFYRQGEGDNNICFVGNSDPGKTLYFSVRMPVENGYITYRGQRREIVNGWLIEQLAPLEFIMGSIEKVHGASE